MAVSDVGVRLVVEAQESFIKALDGAKTAINELTETAKGGFGFTEATTAADILTTAIGVGLYDAVKMTAHFMMDMGKQAFNTVADFERTTQSITAMVAIEKSMGTTVKNVSKGIRELTKKEIEERRKAQKVILQNAEAMEKLVAAQNKLNEADKEGKGSASLSLNIFNIEELERKTAAAHETIDRLNSLEGSEFDIVSEEQINTIEDITEAMRLAKPEADEILDKLTRMALASPFERGPILNTMKQAQAFGFTSKEALNMTETFIKFATVTGRNEGHITRLGYAMGQMNSQGKVMTRQLRQMNMAGLGMDQMAQSMEMSMEEFTAAVSKGKIPFDEFNEKLTAFISKKYTPAFQEINESFYGLKNAISDISKLSLAAFTEGTMEAGKQIMVEFVRPFTQGSALQAIQSFGDGIGKVLEPALTKVAELVRIGMEGFIKFSDLLAGGLPNKEQKLAQDNAGELKKIQKELGDALTNTLAAGTSSSKVFMDAGAAYEWAQGRAITLKDELVLVKAEETRLGKVVKDQQALYDAEGKTLDALKKKYGENSKEFKEAQAVHNAATSVLQDAKKAQITYADTVTKATKAEKDNTASLVTTKAALDKLTGSAKSLNPEYEKLKTQKALLAAMGAQEGDTYLKIVGRMTEMEDATKNYVDNSMHLADTNIVAKDLEEQLKKTGDESKVMGDKMNRQGKPTFVDDFLLAFEKLIPAGGPVFTILKTLEDIFLKIKGKVDKAIESIVNFGKKSDAQKSILDNVITALRYIRDHFEEIWHVGQNVLTVIVGLGIFNRIASYIRLAASALGLFLTPLGLIVGVVGGLTVAYDKNYKGTRQFVDDNVSAVKGWFEKTKAVFDENTETGKRFQTGWKTAFEGVNKLFKEGFQTKGTQEQLLETTAKIDEEGFGKVKTGIQKMLGEFGLFPGTAEKVAGLLVMPLETIKTVLNGIWISFKSGVIDKFLGFWSAKPGTEGAKTAAQSMKDAIVNSFPEGWALPMTVAVDLFTDAVTLLKLAWQAVKYVYKAVTDAAGPVLEFLTKHKDEIVPVTEKVLLLVAALWAVNSAMVAVSGFGLANLAFNIAPESIAGAANLAAVRGRPAAPAATGGLGDLMPKIPAGPDMEFITAGKGRLGEITTEMGRIEEAIARINAKTNVLDLDAIRDAMAQGISQYGIDTNIESFKKVVELTESQKLEIIKLTESLTPLKSQYDEIGAAILREEAISTSALTRIKDATITNFNQAKSKVVGFFTDTRTQLTTLNDDFIRLASAPKMFGPEELQAVKNFSNPIKDITNAVSELGGKMVFSLDMKPLEASLEGAVGTYAKNMDILLDGQQFFYHIAETNQRGILTSPMTTELDALVAKLPNLKREAQYLADNMLLADDVGRGVYSTFAANLKSAQSLGGQFSKAGGAVANFVAKGTGSAVGLIDNAFAPVAAAAKGAAGSAVSVFTTSFPTLFKTAFSPSTWMNLGKAIFAGAGAMFGAGGGLAGIGSLILAAFTSPLSLVISTFTELFVFAGFIFSAIGSVITSPITFALLAVAALFWAFYNNVAGVTDLIIETFHLLLAPIYTLWNAFLAFNEGANVAMESIYLRILEVWEYGIKPTFTKFAEGVAVLISWINWLIKPFVILYHFVFSVLAPVFAIVLYGAFMTIWYVIEAIIAIFFFVIDVVFAVVQAIYGLIKMVFQAIGAFLGWLDGIFKVSKIFNDFMKKIGSSDTKATFRALASFIAPVVSVINYLGAAIEYALAAFKKAKEFLGFDWVTYFNPFETDEAKALLGAVPVWDVVFNKPKPVVVEELADAISDIWTDFTTDEVKPLKGDESALEKVWILATNLMKSPEAKEKAASQARGKEIFESDKRNYKVRNENDTAGFAASLEKQQKADEAARAKAAQTAAKNTTSTFFDPMERQSDLANRRRAAAAQQSVMGNQAPENRKRYMGQGTFVNGSYQGPIVSTTNNVTNNGTVQQNTALTSAVIAMAGQAQTNIVKTAASVQPMEPAYQ